MITSLQFVWVIKSRKTIFSNFRTIVLNLTGRIDPWYWYHLRALDLTECNKFWCNFWWPKSQKLTFKKISRPSKHLRAKNISTYKHANYTWVNNQLHQAEIVVGGVKWLVGYWKVLSTSSQHTKKFLFRLRAQPVSGWQIGFTSKKIDLSNFFNSCNVLHFKKLRKNKIT